MSSFENAVMQVFGMQFPSSKLAAQPPGAVTLVVQPRQFRLGKWAPFVNTQTFMDVVLEWQMNNAPTDQIEVLRAYPANVTQPSVFNHIPHVGEGVGRLA